MNVLLILDLAFDQFNRIIRLHFQSDCFASESFHKNLHEYKPEFDGSINCVTAIIFGWDPAPGVVKVCQCFEKEIDPRKCLGGEDPLVCYGKRIPQEGMVRGLLGIFGGVAEAIDLGKKCQNEFLCATHNNSLCVCVSLFYVIDTGSIRPRARILEGPRWGLPIYPSPLAQTLAVPIYPYPYWVPQSTSRLW